MNKKKTLIALVALIVLVIFAIPMGEYADLPGFSNKHQTGRTKNSLATLVAAKLAHELYPNQAATVDLAMEKSMFPDTTVTGTYSPNKTEITVPVTFSSATLGGNWSGDTFSGTVDKSEFDWTITQTGDDWNVDRALLKFTCTLKLTAKDGKITGVYERPVGFDWHINGTYTEDGQINLNVDGSWCLGFDLVGTIKPLR